MSNVPAMWPAPDPADHHYSIMLDGRIVFVSTDVVHPPIIGPTWTMRIKVDHLYADWN